MEKKELILGRNPVMEYLRSGNTSTCLYISEKAHGRIIDQITAVAKEKKVHIERKEKDFFKKLGPSSSHQGIALEVTGSAAQKNHEFSKGLIHQHKNSSAVLVMLDHLTDPHNVGSIIRSAEALGAAGIITADKQAAGITPTVVKTSAGATAHIAVETVTNVAVTLDEAKKIGWWIMGTTDHGTASLDEVKTIRPLIIVIGSEGSGMKRLTEEKCDFLVNIPLKGQVTSLNASVAAGIVLYEILK